MKALLPSSKNIISGGFTLIELLIVVAIIAILATIGIAVFSGQQAIARDARRKADIQAIANALEANKVPNTSTYNNLQAVNFTNGVIPQDTTTAKYCVSAVSSGTPADVPTIWPTNSVCPSNPTGYVQIDTANPSNTTTAWRICALLENGTNPTTYCLANAQ